MDIKFNYNDTLSTSTSQDDLELDFSSKDKTLLSAKANEPFEFPKIAPVNTNTDINTDDVLSSSTKRNIIVNFESNEPTYVTNHTRDFYRGRSFRFAGVWTSGVHYISDEYVVDFVVKDNALLACSKSHMSSSENEPTEWIEEDGEKYAIISDYWELVISGVTGKAGEEGGVYLPSYDEENDRLVWTLVESKDLESPIYVALGLNNKIDAAIGPIQSDLNGIHSDIDNLNNNISELEVITTSISGDISGINSNVSALEQRVSDNEGSIGQLELTSSEFAVRMENAEGEVGQLKLTAHEFSVEMSNLQGDVGRLWLTAQEFGVRISNAEGDVSLLKQTADEIQTRVENAEGDVSQLHQRADEIWSQVENNQGDISRISQRADEIQSQVSNNTGDISRISQRADEISSQVENAQGDISRIEQRADSIESTVQNAQGDISQLRQTADEISSRVENAEGDISQISQRADEISSRVENAEGSISEIRQTAEEISSTVETNKQLADGAIAENRSLISQTAEEIRTEVEQNITRLDGDIEQNRSEIRQTAEEITSTVERNKIDVDGQIESARSEIRQTADEISATVERNKQETDGSITELRSNITQTAEEIRSDVSRVESDLNGNIESARSEIRQTADEIATTVEQNKIDLDGDIAELRSNITQTAEAITATVEANKQAADGAIENLSSEIRQTAEEISATVQANKVAVDGAIEELSSNITQTAEEITATVEANKQDSDGKFSQLESVQTQQADLIASKVSQTDYDADNSERETRFSIIEQTASSIESTVQANKIDADDKYIDLSTRITQTEGSITSVVNEITEINGNLLDQQSQIEQLSDEIDLKVSKTEFDNKTGSIDQSISDILLDTAGIHNTVSALSGNLDNTATAFNNYVINTNGLLEALQSQVDGAIETWYYNGVPTLNNLPASEWTTDDDKNTHIGDLYYDKTTEYAYRFMLNNGVYSWEQISDSDIATALQNASRAQATADGKMKVFVTTPTPPYQVGDLWVQGSTNNKDGMIYKCITPKVAGQTYSSSDWAIAFDAVTTKVIKSSFDIFADAIQGRVWQEDPNGIITGNTYSLVKQTIDNINLSVASVRNDLLATGIDISGVQYDDQGHVTQGGTVTITADNFILKGNRPNADRALTLVYDSNGVPRISATNLEVEGIFSTTPGSVWMLQKEDIKSYADDVAEDAQLAAEQNAQGFADTAEQNAKDAAQGYADDAESNAKDYTDTRETIIKNYADTVAETWATNKANAAVTSANAYVTNLLWGNGSQSDPEEGSLLDIINSEIFNVADDLSALDGQINGPNGLAADVSNALYGISDLGYLKRALWDGDTAVAGGLIVSSLIQLGTKTYNNADTPIRNADGTTTPGDLNQNTWKVWSGINGVYAPSALGHGIAAWYGGEMLDRGVSGNTDANRAAKSLFRFDGSGYLASNRLRWDASGNLTVDGYILTNEIQLKDNNGNITAGMSGAYDNSVTHFGHGIASWYGGPKIDHEKDPSAASYAKSVFRMDGSGYLAGGQISWGDTGSVVIHGATLQGTNGSITTGQLVERILEIGSWFVKEPYETVDGHTRYYLRLVCGDTTNIAGLASDGFVSAGGLSTGSGTSGIDWEALTTSGEQQIHSSHLSTALSSYINALSSSTTGDFVESISKNGSILTVTYGTFPTSVKNPHFLIVGEKSYDGSADVTITASDLGISSWAQQSTKPPYSLSEISGTTDLRLIEALTGAGFLKRNANNTWTLDDSTYLTTSDAASTYQPLDSDLTAIAAISTGTGLLKRTVSGSTVTWTIDTNQYITGNQTITLSGDVSGSGTTSITTTIGEGKVTNVMLAGSIANNKLANSSITINGSSVSLGGSFNTASITAGTAGQSSASTGAATIAIPYVTVNKYGIVTGYGTHTHTIDDLPNSALQYSSITIGSTSISLGGTSTTLVGLTKVTSTTYSAGGKLEDGTTESTITYDAINHAWKITGSIYATGFVSAGGLSNASGTSGIDWNALSTEGEDQIHRSHLVNALTGYVNNVVTSGTGDYVSSITKSGSTITVNLSTLPTTSSWSSITDKPTTLSGYGITDGVNAVTVNGSGNAVTTATISGHTLTLTKGTTFLTTHQTVTLTSGTNNGTLKLTVGSTVTDNIAVKGLGAAAYKAVGSVASGNTGLVTGGDVYTAINDVITSAIKFRGVTTSSLSDGDTSNTIIIDNESYTAKSGDLVISGGLEFLWTGTKWQLLGDESSYVPKSTTVNGHALTGNISITKSDVGLGNVTNLAASGYFTLFEMDSEDTTKTSITIGGTNKKLVIEYATKASQDANSNTIISSYGASLGAASNALTLKAKDGTTLSTLTAANIVTVLGNTAVDRATGDKNGNDIYNTYVSGVSVGTGDNSNKLGITKAGSTTYITVPYATLANTVTTTADTSNNLYIVGVTSSATTTLKRNSSIVMKSGTLSLTSLSASTSITSPKIYLNANTYFELDANGYVHLVHPTGKGFYADGFVSAGGLSTSGSGGGGDAITIIDYNDVKALTSDSDFTTASAWATHLFYQDVFGSGNTTIVSRISALENSSTNVTYTATQVSGTLLGTITIDGNANNIYAPTIPTSLKNPYSLKFGTKSYDGSTEKTIKAEDLSACVMGTVVGTVTIIT